MNNPICKILIAEDDHSLRKLLMILFEQSDYEFITAKDGEETLQLLKITKVDLVLLDILMPNLSGFDVLKEMKNDPALNQVKVVFFSVLTSQEDINKGLALGADAYILKRDTALPDLIEELKQHLPDLATE